MRYLYKSALVSKLAYRLHLSETCVTTVMHELLDAITASLADGTPVLFPGFGTFDTSQRKAG